MTDIVGVEVRNLTKTFSPPNGGLLRVFENLSLVFDQGSITCIVGPSGCGKSTLLNIIGGLIPPDDGDVRFTIPGFDDTHAIGYMFQNDRLLPWRNTLQNATLGLEVVHGKKSIFRDEAKSLLETFGLSEFEQAWPSELSEGMKQRVAFARTLLVHPKLLLLDEPFSSVDYEIRLQLENVLLQRCLEENTTVIMVTHDLEEAIVLGKHIFVLSPRPARLVDSLVIEEPLDQREALQMRRSREFGFYLGKLAAQVLKS
ncbi:MAG: NitT/TauT family transport system ATP-binding protein [Blastocatellia bacterium]|jgi:NitT/TauT family transport system ATP-binding protein|nr:NitT/TauT family transport system ATP-binding protein [Blastocatellia bacterium]